MLYYTSVFTALYEAALIDHLNALDIQNLNMNCTKSIPVEAQNSENMLGIMFAWHGHVEMCCDL